MRPAMTADLHVINNKDIDDLVRLALEERP